MTKRFLIIVALISFLTGASRAQTPQSDIESVRRFGDALSNWAKGYTAYSWLESLESLCSKSPSVRICDNLMQTLARNNRLAQAKDYEFDTYISCLQKEIDKGISVSFSDVEGVPQSLIPAQYRDRKELNFVSCRIKVSGSIDLSEDDLFVLVKGKIAKIQDYEIKTDKKGRKKLNIDLSDIGIGEDTEGLGLSYNYSKAFPLEFSLSYSKWKFMISVDAGFSFDKDKYVTQKVNFTDILNYKIIRGEYELKYFLTATPAFYMKYFSVGWGFGYASLKGTETTRELTTTLHPDGNITQSTSSSNATGAEKMKFMMRPIVKGYIPCSESFFVSLSVGYDWIVGYKEKSGITFGAGVQFLFD